jgi:hypothetical protein
VSSQPAEKASTAVGLGDVNVGLQVAVSPGEVDCTLKFRGTTVSFVFTENGALDRIRLPGGTAPAIEGT